jgi:hypothetical protein
MRLDESIGLYIEQAKNEEPKQETLTYTEAAKKEERIFNSTMMSKKETPEQAAERLYPVVIKPILDVYDDGVSNQIGEEDINEDSRESFIEGTKWQSERMYSEEEVLDILREFYKVSSKKDFPLTNTIPLWFEQFKNK